MELRGVYEWYKNYILSLSKVKKKAIWYAISIFIILLIFIYVLQRVPQWQVAQFRITNQTDLARLENDYRATLAQIIGGFAILLGLYFTWKNLKVAQDTLKTDQDKFQKNLKVAQDTLKSDQEKFQKNLTVSLDTLESNIKNAQQNLKVAQEGQITERFTKAVDQLGAIDQSGRKIMEIRLGGIYALERIANQSDIDYWPIMEILTAYIRTNYPSEIDNPKDGNVKHQIDTPVDDIQAILSVMSKKKTPVDVQAILTIIGKCKHSFESGESNRLNLQSTNLRYAVLRKARLSEANLFGADLTDADLTGADLSKAVLSGSNLQALLTDALLPGADLNMANLSEADLTGANLSNAELWRVNLYGADLNLANLSNAFLMDANLSQAKLIGTDLSQANLSNADLHEAMLINAQLIGTDLSKADLSGADLSGADLRDANLEGAKNLLPDQLSEVKTLYNAKLDEELEEQLREKYPALFEKPKDEP